MQSLVNFLNWVGETPISQWIAELSWAFPALEVVHVFAISIVFGTVAIIDLRLLGLASTSRPYTAMARELLPWTWSAFGLAALSGGFLIVSRPVGYYENADFRIKFLVMAFAGVNMLVFHWITARNVAQWDKGRDAALGQVRRRAFHHDVGRHHLSRPHDRLHHGAGRSVTATARRERH